MSEQDSAPVSDRMRRQIERLLDEADEAIRQRDWSRVRECADDVLALEPKNDDARGFLAAAERALAGRTLAPAPMGAPEAAAPPERAAEPASFCGGRYQVAKFLGEGGKKRVYLAHDAKLDRDVAFALIKTEGLDEEGQARIRREAQAMGKLGDHPHIVAVYDIGEEADQPYLVSQLMGGGDVEGLIGKAPSHRVPFETALRIADQVCQALEHAHAHGIVHRDLKPGNVWLTADGTAKLGDFGLALALDRTRLTQVGMMVGTVSYMPPEQATGGAITYRSDLYSLGAMLYELVTGRPPFVGDEVVAVIGQHLNTPPVAPSWHTPDLPPALEALILRLLEKDPGQRPASATDVRRILSGVSPSPVAGRGINPQSESPDGQSPRENPLYRRTFVGREAELRQFKRAFDGALGGQGGLVMVVGEPGIGKTALCEQLATYSALRGGMTLVGHCYEEGSLSLPYLAFVEAMRSYVLDREPAGLSQELGSGAAEVARIVSEVRQRLGLEPAPDSAADPDEDRWRLFQAVAGFLRNAAATRPLAIVLEDLHWADRGTLDLLVHLSRNLAGARLLIVGTYRDVEVDRTHPLSASLAELRRAASFDRVLLRGLTADEVQRMLGAITDQSISWGFAEAVHRQTEGNPLFVQEVVRYLAEEGLIQHEDGRWQRAGTTPLEMSIPEGLRDVIGRRLSRLSTECNRVLAVAAVVGRDFDLTSLQDVAGAEADAVIEALEEAVHVGILEEQTRPGAIRYRFTHAFFRQTLYEELSAPRRLRLHQQVARALETRYAARLDEHAAELTDHFAQSTDPADLAKAVKYGELAARRALAVYAYREAARLLASTLEVQEVLDPDDRAKRCDLLLALGEALAPGGEPARVADEVAPAALELAQAMGDETRIAQVCELAVDALHRHNGSSAVFNETYREWGRRWDRYARPGTRARAYADSVMASLLLPTGHVSEANERVLRALELARSLDEPEVLFRAAASFLFPGRPLRYCGEQTRIAREFAERPRDGVRVSTVAPLLQRAQMYLIAAGERERAEAVWRELDAIAVHTRDVVSLLWPLERDAIRATLAGELEDVLALCERLIATASELGIPRAGEVAAVGLVFQPALMLGRWRQALSQHEADLTLGAGRPAIAMIRAVDGRVDEARAIARECLTEGLLSTPAELGRQAAKSEEPIAWLPIGLLEAALTIGDAELVRDVTAAFGDLGDATGVVARDFRVYNVARLLGGSATLRGDRDEGQRHHRRALEWATRVHHRPEIALTRLGMAELLLDGTPDNRAEAQRHLDFAIEEFRAMKMQPALERALRHKGLLHA